MEKTIRVALIGCGSWAREVHIPFLLAQPDIKLSALVDSHPGSAAEELAAKLRIPLISNTDPLYQDKTDAVIISTPHSSHFQYAFEALKNGVHAHVDKPLADTPERVRLLRRLALSGSR